MGQRVLPEVSKQMSSNLTFPVQVYTHGKGIRHYDLTEAEIETQCCMVYDKMYFWNSIPQEERHMVTHVSANLYDIWNCETCEWWNWPEAQLWALYNTKITPPEDKAFIERHFKKSISMHLSTSPCN
jgi:hypothetical protein